METYKSNIDLDAFEFFDSLKFYTSEKFLMKYRMKYSEMLISSFQKQLILSLQKRKPISGSRLVKRLVTKTGLAEDIVTMFLGETGALEELFPIITRH